MTHPSNYPHNNFCHIRLSPFRLLKGIAWKRFQYSFPRSTNFLVLLRVIPWLCPVWTEVRLACAQGKVNLHFPFFRSPWCLNRIRKEDGNKLWSNSAANFPFKLFSSAKKNLQLHRQIVSSSWLDLRQYDNETIYFMQTNTITLRREATNVILLFPPR